MNFTFSNLAIALKAIIAFVIIVVLFFAIFIPVIILRTLVKYLGKLNPDLVRIIGSGDALIFCGDYPYGNPLINIITPAILDGNISFENLCTLVSQNIINVKTTDGESLKFKELQQYGVSFLGFPFYKWDRNFKLENHVKLDKKIIRNAEEYSEYLNTLVFDPWPKYRSTWELVLLENYNVDSKKGNQCAVLFRCHHSLADGLSILDLIITNLAGNPQLHVPSPNFGNTISLPQKILKYISFPFVAMYELTEEISTKCDDNVLYSKNKQIMTGVRRTTIFEKIPVTLIKEIMKNNSVAFQAVVCAAISGGLRKYMKLQKMEIPEAVHATLSVPYPGHPDNICNYFSFAYAKFPLGIANPMERLQMCHKDQTEFRKSTLPYIHLMLQSIMGISFIKMTKMLCTQLVMSTAQFTNFPISNSKYVYGGFPLSDAYSTMGCMNPKCGLSISCTSYNGNIQIITITDQGIVPTVKDAENLKEFITEEFDLLNKLKKE